MPCEGKALELLAEEEEKAKKGRLANKEALAEYYADRKQDREDAKKAEKAETLKQLADEYPAVAAYLKRKAEDAKKEANKEANKEEQN